MPPVAIKVKLSELTDLCERFPDRIPVSEVAKFLGMSNQSLLASAAQGRCPFAIGAEGASGRREAYVITTALWFWITKGGQT